MFGQAQETHLPPASVSLMVADTISSNVLSKNYELRTELAPTPDEDHNLIENSGKIKVEVITHLILLS